VIVACLLVVAAVGTVDAFEFVHHDQAALMRILDETQAKCPDVSRVYSLPEKSVKGRDLRVIVFGKNPGQHVPGIPEFKYVGNMHGNEVVGREVLLKLVDDMCSAYLAGDAAVAKLISLTRIHIMPTMNPDGYAMAAGAGSHRGWVTGRANARMKDLNRNFPDVDRKVFQGLDPKVFDVAGLQPETRALIRWILSTPFVLSANLHGGDLVANYPYDESKSGKSREYSQCPDDATFRKLAAAYSEHHAVMSKPHKPCDMDNDDFGNRDGITNGAEWYSLKGGMQDFNYLVSNCFEITLELGCDKFPDASKLQSFWNDNKDALYNFMWQVHTGVKGVVSDAATGKPISGAVISVVNTTNGADQEIDHAVISAADGDFYRLLIPGTYTISASAAGYAAGKADNVVVENPFHAPAKIVDLALKPAEAAIDGRGFTLEELTAIERAIEREMDRV